MSDKHVVVALQRTVADLEIRLREVVRERDEGYEDRRRARAEYVLVRSAWEGAEAALVAECEHSERLRREAGERHDELRAEIENLRSCLAALQEASRATMRVVAAGQREVCALHLCPKVPHSACSDFHCEAGVVRATPLVTEGDP
jgi:chromosome segregation ATPase